MSDGFDFFICGVSISVLIPCGIIFIGMDNGDLWIKLFGVFLILFGAFLLIIETIAVNGLFYRG